MLAVRRLTAADVPGVSDIAGEVVRQAAADGRDGTLFKSTAPGPQPRRAGSTAIHEISPPPRGRGGGAADPARGDWAPRGASGPGPGAGRCGDTAPRRVRRCRPPSPAAPPPR